MDVVQQNKTAMFVRVVLLKNVSSCVMRRLGNFTQADVLSTQLRLEGAFLFMFCLLQILITTNTHTTNTVCNTATLGNDPPPRTRGSLSRRDEGKNRPAS